MKIKTYVSNTLAVCTLVALLSGFQISSPDSVTNNLTSMESMLGVKNAYAGPCGDAGCDGNPGYCGTTTVIKVFGLKLDKDCVGSEKGDFPDKK